MLAIRMQRTGRKGTAMFRVIVQDSRKSPKSGRIVAQLGSYNPHSKETQIDKEKISFYLEHGAQPSDRIARLLKKEGVKLPKWVSLDADGERSTRNPEKLRKNRPADAEAPAEESKEGPAAESVEETTDEKPAEAQDSAPEASAEETPAAEESTPEKPAE